jgi:hypothetical protein
MNSNLVYESPDGGGTVYARLPGSTERWIVSKSDEVLEKENMAREDLLWKKIRKAAKENKVLKDAIDRVIIIYNLSQSDEKENTS